MFLNILYKPSDHDNVFRFLKLAFGVNVADVQVDSIVPEQFVVIRWEGLLDPNELAAQLSAEVPEIIVECLSNTGIDTNSRYFNSTQLW
jgi:hypothetical protein